MEVLLAKSAGFCFGVKRATRMAFDAADKYQSLQSLGPLIHSPQMVKKLEERGIRVCEQVEESDGEAIVVRSHGVTAEEQIELKGSDKIIVDATCPFVTRAQAIAKEMSEEGYLVLVVGEAHHPEVQGIVSYASGDVVVVASPEEARALPKNRKIGIIAQTTQSIENFRAIAGACLGKAHELKVYNTICDATSVRQEEAVSIAGKVDLMLVVGGYNSANTARLADLCRDQGTLTYHVETADEINPVWFKGIKLAGLTAGASTPQFLIDEIVAKIAKL